MGLLGITVGEAEGGLGKGVRPVLSLAVTRLCGLVLTARLSVQYLDHLVVMEELSRASGSIALSYGAQCVLASFARPHSQSSADLPSLRKAPTSASTSSTATEPRSRRSATCPASSAATRSARSP